MKRKVLIHILLLIFSIYGVGASSMTFIRHATFILDINNKKILVDPMLADIGRYEPIPMSNNKNRFPLNPIDTPIDEITNVDGVIITHNHIDHFDDVAKEVLDKELSILCQPSDYKKIKSIGFRNITVVGNKTNWLGIEIERFNGTHGGGVLNIFLGKSSSYLLKSDHKNIFITGDALLTKRHKKILKKIVPDTIIAYGGSAKLKLLGQITMNSNDIVDIAEMLPSSNIIAIHMDSVNHCEDTSNMLNELVKEKKLKILIPESREKISL